MCEVVVLGIVVSHAGVTQAINELGNSSIPVLGENKLKYKINVHAIQWAHWKVKNKNIGICNGM